jgi:hypothetical protein
LRISSLKMLVACMSCPLVVDLVPSDPASFEDQ